MSSNKASLLGFESENARLTAISTHIPSSATLEAAKDNFNLLAQMLKGIPGQLCIKA